jgi:hypothetical protein
VGKTAVGVGTVGAQIQPDGFAGFTRSAQDVMFLTRLSTDGSILTFRKDGATVGSIGTENSHIYLTGSGVAAAGLRLQSNNIITPMTNGSLSDNTVDLGYSTNRFKDLYLSGTANVGDLTSTGSIIKIDTASTASLVLDSGTSNSARQYFGNNGVFYATIAAHPLGDPSGTGHGIALCAGSGGGDVRFGGMNVGENLVEIGGIFKNTALNVRGNATFNQTLNVGDAAVAGVTNYFRVDGTGQNLKGSVSHPATALTNCMIFYNANGQVGTIRTLNSATQYNTLSDPRLKSEFTPITGASAMILEARDQGLIGEFAFLSDPTQTVWGYNAHKVTDLQVGFGGSEGEGPRELELGSVYEEAVMGERPVMVAELDEEGEPTGEMIESGELEAYEVSPEKTVSPAGIDQSKRVPILEAAIGELLDRIAVIEASNEALLDRITALENT